MTTGGVRNTTHQHWQVDQEMGVPGVDPVLGQVSRNQIVHDEVEGGQLPVVVAHGQVPEFPERELTVVERVCEEEDGSRHQSDWNYCCNPEVENLERREHRLVRDTSLKPEKERNKGKEDEGWPVENSNCYKDSDWENKLEIVWRDYLSFLLDLDSFSDTFCLLVAVLDKLLQVDCLVRPLHGVCHHVQQQRGHHQLQGVAEGPRGVDNHHIAGSQRGQALIVAVLVKLADLVNTGIHCERKCEHDEPWHQLDDIRPYEDLNAKFGVQEQIEILESADREPVEEEGEGRTAQRSRDVELPRAMRVKFQNIA